MSYFPPIETEPEFLDEPTDTLPEFLDEPADTLPEFLDEPIDLLPEFFDLFEFPFIIVPPNAGFWAKRPADRKVPARIQTDAP